MADKDSNQRRSTRQERPLYQAGPKNEQSSKLPHPRDTSTSSINTKLEPPSAPMEKTEKLDPMEAVGKKLAEMSLRGPPGYFSRSSSDKSANFQSRPYSSNNNMKNNNHQINTTNNNRNSNFNSNDFSRHQSTDSLNGGYHSGGRYNTFNGSKDSWNPRNNDRPNDRRFPMSNGGYHNRGSRYDEGRNSFQGDDHRSFSSGTTHYEGDRPRENHNSHNHYDGNRSDRYRDPPARNHDSHDYQDRNDRQGSWRNVPRQNDGGSWRRGPNNQQGDFHRGSRDNHRRLVNGSRDSLHSVSSARSNDSRMKRSSPIRNHSQNPSRVASGTTVESPKHWMEADGRRTPRDDSDVTNDDPQSSIPDDQTTRSDRPRRERRRRSRSQSKKASKPEQQDESRPQEPCEPAEQREVTTRRDWCDLAAEEPSHPEEPAVTSDTQEGVTQASTQPEPEEPEVAQITEKAPETKSRIDWSECPTPPPLEELTVCPPPTIPEPIPEPPEVEVRVSSSYPEESWRNPRSRQNSESSSGQTSNSSSFRQWERQRDHRNNGFRGEGAGGRRSPLRDDSSYSSFHRRAQSPGPRYQDSKDRRPYERYGNAQSKRYLNFNDSLPPRFRNKKRIES